YGPRAEGVFRSSLLQRSAEGAASISEQESVHDRDREYQLCGSESRTLVDRPRRSVHRAAGGSVAAIPSPVPAVFCARTVTITGYAASSTHSLAMSTSSTAIPWRNAVAA